MDLLAKLGRDVISSHLKLIGAVGCVIKAAGTWKTAKLTSDEFPILPVSTEAKI